MESKLLLLFAFVSAHSCNGTQRSRINTRLSKHGVQRRMISVDNFFRIFGIIIFCIVVAICDLVHVVETMYSLLKC